MSAPFTPEQERRIFEIVAQTMAEQQRKTVRRPMNFDKGEAVHDPR
ncbi:MAG: hypothetical protein AAFP79_05085 [Pseudomonadota bacterium]